MEGSGQPGETARGRGGSGLNQNVLPAPNVLGEQMEPARYRDLVGNGNIVFITMLHLRVLLKYKA